MDFRTSQLVQELGLNGDQPLLSFTSGVAENGSSSSGLEPTVSLPGLSQQSSVVSSTGGVNGGSATNRSRGFSNIFGGISTLD
jgi:hypothetical protein